MSTAELEQHATDELLHWAHDDLGLTFEQIGATLQISERTLRRWRSHQHAPQSAPRRRIEDLHHLRHLLREVFPDPTTRAEWLHGSSPMLRGRTPISYLRAGRVASIVTALATLESGAFL